ncbi:hypothetical protein KPL74_04615 [Bacillus sp. NP157]|nr:hypothetical protein KPL74_04615 [Bacillus sp. NP157]
MRKLIRIVAAVAMAASGATSAASDAGDGQTNPGSAKEPQTASVADGQVPVSPAARQALARIQAVLDGLRSTNDLTPGLLEQAMGIKLLQGSEPGESIYQSPDLGAGWTYTVAHWAASRARKPGLRFWFFNENRSASPATVCGATFDAVREGLMSHGYEEQETLSEIGGVEFLTYVKSDIRLTLTRHDVVTISDGKVCVVSFQTANGM